MAPPSSTPEVPPQPFNAAQNPYPAKKIWPPNLANMDRKYQFRLEKRYRRRAQLAYLRPGWIKGVKIAQFSLISAVVAYSVLWLDWGGNPFGWVRELVGIDTAKKPFDADVAHERIASVYGERHRPNGDPGR